MRLVARVVPVLALLVVLLAVAFPPRALSLPLYAARMGLMCQSCHFDPNGGGPRNDYGFAFARNRHALMPDTSGAWKDLNLTNRIGDAMPVYLGLNQRFMLLGNAAAKTDSLDRVGFFNMENALYVSFQPHSRLTLVYSRDAFNEGVLAQDAFGLIGGFPWDGYIKAGRFRTPFGLRMDDHTVATRNGFLDFQSGRTFLPYDVRFPDMGVEVGADHANFFGRAAYTNGGADVLGLRPDSQPYAQTVTAKLGYNHPRFQAAVSIYDDYERQEATSVTEFRRATRWGLYGVTHWRQFALLSEVAAGTDRDLADLPHNLLAGWAEADYAFGRVCNVRVRYDRLETDRGSIPVLRDLNTWDRYSLEGEYLPVPFAELRWALRLVAPKADHDLLGNERVNEKQAFLQMHFSY
jgi:hypothetical protein